MSSEESKDSIKAKIDSIINRSVDMIDNARRVDASDHFKSTVWLLNQVNGLNKQIKDLKKSILIRQVEIRMKKRPKDHFDEWGDPVDDTMME